MPNAYACKGVSNPNISAEGLHFSAFHLMLYILTVTNTVIRLIFVVKIFSYAKNIRNYFIRIFFTTNIFLTNI